jgi:protein required for attachment to host cells
MKEEWILVASRDEARIFSRRGMGPLSLICDMGNPVGRLKAQDLESDTPGRSTDNRMRARHAYSTEESMRDRFLRDFYREVLERIEKADFAHQYDTLTLIAEPRLLGIIRALLPPGVKSSVTREIAKDLSFEDDKNILERLSQH